MAAKAIATPSASASEAGEDMYFIAMPMVTYRAISDVGMKRGMTFAQALQQALNQWIATPVLANKPQLIVEPSKK